MTGNVPGQGRTYGGWQQEKVDFIFGLSGRRAALLGAAVLAVIIPVARGRIGDAAVFWPAAVVLALAVFARFAGRTVDEWAATAVSYAVTRFLGQHRFASGPFAPPAPDANGEPQLDLPGILAPLRLLSVPAANGRDLAVIHHPYDETWTAVAKVRCPGIGLADSARQDQRVASWGTLLASLCTEGSPVIRVQVVQRLVPESGAALRSWHEAHLVPDVPELAHQVTGELLTASTVVTTQRESYLAVTVDQRRARGQVRAAGGGETGAATVLVRQLQAMAQAIGGADLEIIDWLGTRDLAEVIRTAFDPGAQLPLAARRAAAGQAVAMGLEWDGLAPGTAPDSAGPVYAEARPGSYVHDGAESVSYWIREWSRAQAFCTALGPLLADGSHQRSFGMIFEPLGPRAAERAVMRERTARHVAVRMRQRTGQVIPEHERSASAKALGQDAERAAGHGLVRFAGYLTVTVTDPARLADACAAAEADAAQAGIELNRMWFAQDSGFAVTLPLGLGLPRRRW
jgi:hypothetical protein